jgi:hypothetical protein
VRLSTILKDSDYRLTQFGEDVIQKVEYAVNFLYFIPCKGLAPNTIFIRIGYRKLN